MLKLIKQIQKRVNHLIYSLITAGVVLLLLAVLIVWSNFILQLVVGLFVLVIAYMFFFAARKIWLMKRDIERYFKIK